jgi:hypothetical protein
MITGWGFCRGLGSSVPAGHGPELLEHLRPLVGDLVALVVLALGEAEHRELGRVPAGDDVEAEASARDVVGCAHHLGGQHRVGERDVEGREDLDALRRGEQAARPRERLEGAVAEVGAAAVAAPARDRDDRVQADAVGVAGEPQVLLPARLDLALDVRERHAAAEVDPEQRQLEGVLIAQDGLAVLVDRRVWRCAHRAPSARCGRDRRGALGD